MGANDQRTTEELFAASLEGDYDNEAAWDAVHALRLRNTEEVFRSAARHARSGEARERARALDVLAQLGAGRPMSERPHFSESVETGIEGLHDTDAMVVSSAAW